MTAKIERSRHSREYVKLELISTPPITSWEVTFDEGVTWQALAAVAGEPNFYRVLVAGPSVALGSALVQVARTCSITARATDSSEIVARNIGSLTIL